MFNIVARLQTKIFPVPTINSTPFISFSFLSFFKVNKATNFNFLGYLKTSSKDFEEEKKEKRNNLFTEYRTTQYLR